MVLFVFEHISVGNLFCGINLACLMLWTLRLWLLFTYISVCNLCVAAMFKWNKDEMDLACPLTVFQTKVSLDAIISFHLLPELCTSVVSVALTSSHKLFHLASSVSSTPLNSSVLFRLQCWVLCQAWAEFSLFRQCLTVATGVYGGQLQTTEASGQAEVIRCSSQFHSVTSPVYETHERPVGLPLHWTGR